MNSPRAALAAVGVGKSVYAMGGSSGVKECSGVVEVYRKDEGRWTTLSPMTTPRSAFGAVSLADGNIYAIGGFNGKTQLNTVEYYDPRNGQWEIAPNMNLPFSVSAFGCCKY